LGQTDRAIADYDRAIRLVPGYAQAFYNRGLAYDDKGEPDRAIANYDQAIRLVPTYAMAFYRRGLDLRGLGRQAPAEEDFAKARELNSKLRAP
jgi:tetratricopeptide (TPR) repeat protein